MLSFAEFSSINEITTLAGKSAIVTGGARGIGLAISYRLAEAGATVFIADIDNDFVQRASQQLGEIGYKTVPVQCDVSIEDDVMNLARIAVNKTGGIDILVNNAGIYPVTPLQEITETNLDRVISVNVKGTLWCSREASRYMIEQNRGGCIINLASIDSVHPSQRDFAVYDASKGAILTLTKSLALELGQYDIRVNAIAPGGILTEGVLSDDKGTTIHGKARLKSFMARTPLGRMGRADDVARVALFLASDLASYITGAMIAVDGGYLIS